MNGSSHHARRAYRPAHPPFTAFPIAAYVFAAAFDTASVIGGPRHSWAVQLWHAGTFVLIAGLVTCLMAMGTGFRDLVRFAARRPGDARPSTTSADATATVAAHVAVVAATFMIGSGDLAWRLSDQGARAAAPIGPAALSLAAAAAAGTGGFLGGKLVFSHGIGVRRPAQLPGPEGGPAGASGGGLAGVGGGRAGDKNLPEPAAGRDHGRGAQDGQGARAAAAGSAAAGCGRRKWLR
ncbi:MAG TPA: DUF2231 domain-containing protein [Streptosporangiaceae bacterium]|nr:DUF2231 domain-containing protein [Streptosporangiaceae bacterium]